MRGGSDKPRQEAIIYMVLQLVLNVLVVFTETLKGQGSIVAPAFFFDMSTYCGLTLLTES